MILTFHTPTGVVTIDSETATDEELASIGLTRENFESYLAETSFGLRSQVNDLEARVTKLERR